VYSGIPVIPGFLSEIKSLKRMYFEINFIILNIISIIFHTLLIINIQYYKFILYHRFVNKNTNLNNFCISPKVMENGICYSNYHYYFYMQTQFIKCNVSETCSDDKITIENYKDVTSEIYFYNAFKNKCLRTDGLPESSITYGVCDGTDNTVWIVPNSHDGYYRSKVNPDYCLSIEDGIVSLKECNDNTIIYRDGNLIKASLFDNYCIGSSENDPNEISLKQCNENELDQIWYFNNYDPSIVIENTPVDSQSENVTVYFYNAGRNVCINSDGLSVTSGSCDLNNSSLWEIPISHNGYYRSKTNPEKCLSIIDGIVSLTECSEDAKLYRDGNFIKSPLSENNCIGSDISIKECDANDSDQIWYFNIFDSSAVVQDPVITQPETVTIYFYNAFKNICIASDGSKVITGECDFSDNSLWEIPISHDGYYRLKANPEKCLSIIDGVVSLSECNEDTILYRDGLFIRSPSFNDYCISSSKFENTLEYVESCSLDDSDNIWYFNVWTAPVDETPEPITSEVFDTTTEEKPTKTVTTTVTEAF